MINNTTLVGRITKDPELKYTSSGIAVVNFALAVERNFTNAQGERETDFIDCVIWREKAENLSKFALKGSLLGITGSIQTRNYENNEGRTVYVTEVLADNFQMLEPKSVTDARRGGQQNQQQSQQKPASDNPFDNITTEGNPFQKQQAQVNDIKDDDLPF